MEPKANPIPKQGERNVNCPFYNDCLDYAVKGSWQSWNCSQCSHKLLNQSITECEYEINGPEPYYDSPLEIYRGVSFTAAPGRADNNDLLKFSILTGREKRKAL